jgi:hypothetical protein
MVTVGSLSAKECSVEFAVLRRTVSYFVLGDGFLILPFFFFSLV